MDVSSFYRACVDEGVTPTLSKIHGNSAHNHAGVGLTDPQREALEAALTSGYYTVPRETTLQELAESLGISDTALSQRLRRGLTTLLSSSMRLSPADSLDIEGRHEDQDGDDEQH